MKNDKVLNLTVLFNRRGPLAAACAMVALLGLGQTTAHAHGFEGDRFFPPTISTDDPFATDELLLPEISLFKTNDTPPVHIVDTTFEFDKEIFPKFALGVSGGVQNQSSTGGPTVTGFDNLELSAKYQLWENPEHEAIVSVGLNWELGGSGSRNIAVDTSSTITPTIYFGKGFGDLPDCMAYFRPIAVTGTFGEDLPTGGQPKNLAWGVAFEYSLPYLQTEVKDIGLPHPLRDLIPLVEFSFNTPPYANGGPTTGTINPGVLYESTYFQIGVEAIIPLNRQSGSGVGAVVQVQIFLDDILPKVFGHPVFGGE
jgi:hypothetical protein